MPKKTKAKEEEVKVEAEGVEAPVEAPAEEAKPEKASKNSTTFDFKNGGTRTFSKEVHGEDWKALADEFESNNKPILSARDGKAL